MKKQKQGVFLLSIGDELLDGRTQNTNASWIGEQLRLAGVPVAEVRCVSDRVTDIVGALREGKNYSLVVATGGLGPTNDDRTLIAAAKAFARPLAPNKTALAHVRSRYEARGVELTPARLKLANFPRGAKVIDNPTGTAPGAHLVINKTNFYFFPGPPHECRPMFANDILPRAAKIAGGRRLLRREFWRTFGRGEGDIYGRISSLVEALEQKYPETFTFGVHISFPYIDLTLEIWDQKGKKKPATSEIDDACDAIRLAMGSLVFTRERENLVDVVARLLKEKKKTLATAESCTGGLLGKMLTDLPGSSAYYAGGVVTYANSAKEKLLGVKPFTLARDGAVSSATVKEMAEGVRASLRTDYSVAISGIAGPGGGTKEKPVGLVHVAFSHREKTKTAHQVILNGKGSRDQIRVIAAHLALDMLRDALREQT